MDVWRLVLVAIKEMPRLLLLSVSIWTFESSGRPPLVLVAWPSIGIGFLVPLPLGAICQGLRTVVDSLLASHY